MGPVWGLSRVVARFSRATGRGAAVFGVALALGLAAASPAAANPWTTATNLSEEGQNAYVPKVAVDGAGGAIVVWTRYNGSKDVVQAALKPAGEPWGKSVTLSEAGEEASEPQVAMDLRATQSPCGAVTTAATTSCKRPSSQLANLGQIGHTL